MSAPETTDAHDQRGKMTQDRSPMKVEENRVWRFYTGGRQLEEARGRAGVDTAFPEEWLGSSTQAAGEAPGVGLSRVAVASGGDVVLKDAIAADPLYFLGESSFERFGYSSGLLVKLLDPAERLPIHAHPSREFAMDHFGSMHGKSEAWIVLGIRPDQSEPCVHVGLKSGTKAAEFMEWIGTQDRDAMLASMHRLPVSVGDVIFVPAGLPHSIGPGLFLAEVQEPTDYSFMCEYEGYPIAREDAFLGLTLEEGEGCLDLTARSLDEIEALCRVAADGDKLLHGTCEEFFAATRYRDGGRSPGGRLEIVLCTWGEGTISTETGSISMRQGEACVVPAAANGWQFTGPGAAISFEGPRTSIAN
jgi:mannose-6-phosphate isomerase